MIMEGSRNSTMSHYASKVIKRFGDTDEAYQLFLDKAALCNPPLDDSELATIWKSAQNFYSRIAIQEGYVAPDDFNNDFEFQMDLQYKPIDYTDVGQAEVLQVTILIGCVLVLLPTLLFTMTLIGRSQKKWHKV